MARAIVEGCGVPPIVALLTLHAGAWGGLRNASAPSFSPLPPVVPSAEHSGTVAQLCSVLLRLALTPRTQVRSTMKGGGWR